LIRAPENIVANRLIGVSAPVPFQPWIGPSEDRPSLRWACIQGIAALADVIWTGGTMSAGRSPEDWPNESALESSNVVANLVAGLERPAKGAVIPPKLSQGDTDGASRAWSSPVADAALIASVALLAPSM
jgi:hypothetical protein